MFLESSGAVFVSDLPQTLDGFVPHDGLLHSRQILQWRQQVVYIVGTANLNVWTLNWIIPWGWWDRPKEWSCRAVQPERAAPRPRRRSCLEWKKKSRLSEDIEICNRRFVVKFIAKLENREISFIESFSMSISPNSAKKMSVFEIIELFECSIFICVSCSPVRNWMSSLRVRSTPRASAIVDSLRMELSRSCTSSLRSSSMSTAIG